MNLKMNGKMDCKIRVKIEHDQRGTGEKITLEN
jgi:hypothetical protein